MLCEESYAEVAATRAAAWVGRVVRSMLGGGVIEKIED